MLPTSAHLADMGDQHCLRLQAHSSATLHMAIAWWSDHDGPSQVCHVFRESHMCKSRWLNPSPFLLPVPAACIVAVTATIVLRGVLSELLRVFKVSTTASCLVACLVVSSDDSWCNTACWQQPQCSPEDQCGALRALELAAVVKQLRLAELLLQPQP